MPKRRPRTPGNASRRPRQRAAFGLSCVAALLAFLAVPAAAPASVRQQTIFDPQRELTGALRDHPGILAEALNDVDALGVDAVRVLVFWRDVVVNPDSNTRPCPDPENPAAQPLNPGSCYKPEWGPYDAIVRAIAARGMRVILVPTGKYPNGAVPRWASNASTGLTDPDPQEFRRFTQALGTRYRGGYDPSPLPLDTLPGVHAVGIWNEGNSRVWLTPQYKGGAPYAPRLYRRLYIAGRQGLVAGGFPGQIWLGETAPAGNKRAFAPVPFINQVLCMKRTVKRRRGRGQKRIRWKTTCPPIRAHGYAHHPYTGISLPSIRPVNRGDVTMGNLGRLSAALTRAQRAGAVNYLPLHLTEYGVQSNPPDTLLGVPLRQQAEFRSIAEFIAFRNPRVAGFSQYLLRDDEGTIAFQAGLRFASGGIKPAYSGFRTPLVVRRVGSRCLQRRRMGQRNRCVRKAPRSVQIWGHVRPANGPVKVRVDLKDGRGWKVLAAGVRTDSRGYFTLRGGFRRGRLWRVVWKNVSGPPTRSYRF